MAKTDTKFGVPDSIGLALGAEGDDVAAVQRFLHRFGHLKLPHVKDEYVALKAFSDAPIGMTGSFDEATRSGLLRYQAFFGLEETGIFDSATQQEMRKPRCGVPDLDKTAIAAYVAQGDRWPRIALTYSFADPPQDFDIAIARTAAKAALKLWSDATILVFTEVPLGDATDFVIRFVSGDHGDGQPFDGVGTVLAHAFYPPPNGGGLAGDAHFNEATTWTVSLPTPYQTHDFVTVAAHEFGHSLGLSHSPHPESLMYPVIIRPHRYLHMDDIQGIRSIYPWGWNTIYQQDELAGGVGGFDIRAPADRATVFDFEGSGKSDHLVFYRPGSGAIFIMKNVNGAFLTVYAEKNGGSGVGGFDLRSPSDRVAPIDFDGTGKLDHLVLYRPGSGAIFIVKAQGGSFATAYAQIDPGSGIGGYDLRWPTDQCFAFDFDGSGKQDHLVFFRPGGGAIYIMRKRSGNIHTVFSRQDRGGGVGGFDLLSPLDQGLAFDFNSSGKQDHLVFYRPGSGAIAILRRVGADFSPVYFQNDPGSGLGGFDLRSRLDRIIAIDYDRSGKQDHLMLFRPGSGAVVIVKFVGGQYNTVYSQVDPGYGIGSYDLRSPSDLALAYDLEGTGRADHLVLFRPGRGAIHILAPDR